MEILLLLYLGHLLGDYPLQSNWVYKQKIKSFLGGLWHILDLLVAYLLCLTPFLYLPQIWTAILLVLIVHFFQDVAKINFNREMDHERESYFMDQFLHFFFSTLIYFWILFPLGHLTPSFGASFYLNPIWIIYAIGLVLVTYFVDVTQYVVSHPGQIVFKRNWKYIFQSALLYSAIFGIYIYLS